MSNSYQLQEANNASCEKQLQNINRKSAYKQEFRVITGNF